MKKRKMSRQLENRITRLHGLLELEERALVFAINEADKKFRESIGAGSFDVCGAEMEEWSTRANFYRRRLERVRDSLNRLQVGEFGICASCNEEISYKRLEAVPTANYCLECQQLRESSTPNVRWNPNSSIELQM